MSLVAGIDYSTHAIDVVLIDEDNPAFVEWVRYGLNGPDAFTRARNVASILAFAWVDDTIAVGIEDPRGQNAGVLYRVQGAILTRIPQSTLVVPWVPSQWRKAVGLPGNATKLEVGGWARRGNPERIVWEQDACDAYCIAHATLHAIQYLEGAAA